MHEVVTVSCSQSAGHAAAQLYNVQESHIPYTRSAVVRHHNNVFLSQVRVGTRSNYYPRNISVQFSGGYGGLRKHEYSEKPTDPAQVQDGLQLVDLSSHAKNQYQQRLDSGLPTSADLLSLDNTRFWTDYSRLVYRPHGLLELPNFQLDGTHRHFPRMTFSGPASGQAEFAAVEDALDDTFRRNLEAADSMQGVNVLSEVNNAWGSFSNAMIEYLRDEYFNGGAKHNLWVYGFLRPGVSSLDKLSGIRSFADFARNATLFFPMQVPAPGPMLLPAYDPSSLWHSSAVQAVFINSLWSLNCSMDGQVKMASLESNLLRGYDKRNVVNEIRLVGSESGCKKPKTGAPFSSDVSDITNFSDIANISDTNFSGLANISDISNLSDITNISDVKAPGLYAGHAHAPSEIRLGVSDSASADFSCNVVKQPGSQHVSPKNANVYENPHLQEILNIDSFPRIMQVQEFTAEFGTSSSLREKLKKDRQIVSRVRVQEHVDAIGGDKAELIEDLSNLIDEYSGGYSDESDYE